jgi:hypothetical protein
MLRESCRHGQATEEVRGGSAIEVDVVQIEYDGYMWKNDRMGAVILLCRLVVGTDVGKFVRGF